MAADDVTKESGGQMDGGPELAEKLAAMGTSANSDPRVYNISSGLRVQQMAWIGQWVASDLTEQTEAPSAGAGVAAMGTGTYSDARVYYLDVSGHVHQLAWSNGRWSHTPLALGPAANLKSNVVAMRTGANLDPRSATGHVLAWTGQWSHLDVFTLTGEPLPNAILLPNALAVIGVG
jgi:hypothetical protein